MIDVTLPTGGDLAKSCSAVSQAFAGKLGTSDATNLVIVTHGWNGAGNEPADQADLRALADEIRLFINTRVQPTAVGLKLENWDVLWLRWTAYANGHIREPWGARNNAIRIGDCLGQLPELGNYEYIHMVAHSAGTALIDSTTNSLKDQDATKDPEVHLTMLDAFVPLFSDALWKLGASADWADHYFRRDALASCRVIAIGPVSIPTNTACFLGLTDRPLPNACNIDTTNLTTPDGVNQPHSGPVAFYRDTVATPGTPPKNWGFGKSREVTGNDPALCADGSVGRLKNDRTLDPGLFEDIKKVITGIRQVLPSAWRKTTGSGTVEVVSPTKVRIASGSPVAAEATVQIDDRVNALQFGFQFLSPAPADGVLEMDLDGQPFWVALESSGESDTGAIVFLPAGIAAGQHTLTIRLDNGTGAKSVVEIDNLELVDVVFGAGPIPPLPPATGSGMGGDGTDLPLPLVVFGVILLLAGGAVVAYARRVTITM
ncbi:MAG: hypothetical protein HY875_03580 [Chloroflexi bacterium]|nr:hypothetical protein [Chloroflexota bacterium]